MPSRSGAATKLLELFANATLLGAIAAKALDGTEDRENAARKLVARAGGAGAYALYSARLRHGVFEARERFVAILHELGTAASPVIVAGLEKLDEKIEVAGALGVAEDLLKAMPNVADARAAALLARYADRPQASLAVLATSKLARVAREDARPQLVRLASNKDDRIAIAAIGGIRELGLLGADMVQELETIVLGAKDPKTSIRIAAVQALTKTTAAGKPPARALLAKMLATQQGGSHETEDLVVVVASTFLEIGGDGELVAERWKASAGFLKTRLEELIRQQHTRPPAS
jgi:hypothetical protein